MHTQNFELKKFVFNRNGNQYVCFSVRSYSYATPEQRIIPLSKGLNTDMSLKRIVYVCSGSYSEPMANIISIHAVETPDYLCLGSVIKTENMTKEHSSDLKPSLIAGFFVGKQNYIGLYNQ